MQIVKAYFLGKIRKIANLSSAELAQGVLGKQFCVCKNCLPPEKWLQDLSPKGICE